MTREERVVAFFALRYSYGRKTYAFTLVRDYIKKHIKEFEKHDLEQMSKETREATVWYDMQAWEKAEYVSFADELLEEATK